MFNYLIQYRDGTQRLTALPFARGADYLESLNPHHRASIQWVLLQP
jgi:hypothetical protein